MTALSTRSAVLDARVQDRIDRTRRTWVAVLLGTVGGILLIQAAWILAVPPFAGLDEHDHAYRAASVARGDWGAHHPPAGDARGELVAVPEDIVTAARPICEALPYTDPENCSPVEDLGGGSVTVASAAARYHPLFYSLIGSPSRFFDGADALYAMRAAAALLCAAFIALAALTTRLWATTPWPMVALLLAATPTFFYSTALAAPNGIEAASALLVWAAVLGLARSSPTSARTRSFVVLAVVGALPLVTVRGLGALWLAMIVGTAALLFSAGHVWQLFRRADVRVGAAVVGGAAALGVGWTLYSASVDTSVGGGHNTDSPWPGIPGQVVIWLLQSVAAFPGRTTPAPALVYAVVLAAWATLTFLGLSRASARSRAALGCVVGASIAIPVVASVTTYEQLGYAWQGRYAYPYALGFLLICGHVLDRSVRAPWRTRTWPVWAVLGIGLTAELVGLLDLLADQVAASPMSGNPAWHTPSPALLIALNVAGAGLLGWATTRRLSGPGDPIGQGTDPTG